MPATADRGGLSGWLFVGTLVGIGAYGGLLLIALIDPQPDNLAALVVAPIVVLVTLPIAVRIARNDGDSTLVAVVLIAVVLKLVASLLRYYVAFDIYGGIADAAEYHKAGSLFAPDLRSLNFDVETGRIPGTGFIELVTGVIYAITGVSRLAGFFVFAWIGMLGQILCWRAFKIGIPNGDSMRYALLVLFFPSMLYWPSATGKDGWMLLTMGLTAYGAARLLRHRQWGFTITAAGIAGATAVRPHVALVMLASLLVALLIRRSPARSTLAPVVRLASITAVVAITLIVVSQAEAFFGIESFDQETVTTTLLSTEASTQQGGSSFTPVTVDTPLDLPLATATVLFRPFPFEADNVQMLATSLEGMALAVLCALSWRRFASIPRRIRSMPYIAFALMFVIIFVYAFSSFANFGILARQRTQVLPFLFVLLALPPVSPRTRSRVSGSVDGSAALAPSSPRRFDRWTQMHTSPSGTAERG